jgi:hypothetical protein
MTLLYSNDSPLKRFKNRRDEEASKMFRFRGEKVSLDPDPLGHRRPRHSPW